MSRFRKSLKQISHEQKARKAETVVNFMGGESYQINSLDTLKMITASSIFGEPSYYQSGGIDIIREPQFKANPLIKAWLLFEDVCDDKCTTQIMESSIDKALDTNFEEVLLWAAELRNDFYMRLNPQVIMVRAAIHPKRQAFTEEHPGRFDEIEQQVMRRADDALSQLAYFLYINKGKKNMPSILKRSIAKKLSSLDAYEFNKYKNVEMGMRDAICITHANSPVIDEFMETGKIQVSEEKLTWECLRSEGRNWQEIFETASMGHMALLRNLKGVFTEIKDDNFCKAYLERLKNGVIHGKQFPFRYYNAHTIIDESSCKHKQTILDGLEECMNIALKNVPRLKGRTMCLSDNSGSAWGTVTSEYGTAKVAVIDNLSAVIAAAVSDDGYVGKFGNELRVFSISKHQGILKQCQKISKDKYEDVGGETEGGIWEFFYKAILFKEHWDNIFIYSDMQAGHGELYGTSRQIEKYTSEGFAVMRERNAYSHCINVFELILEYRRKVNRKVNVYSIQTAGYDNVLVPEYAYRTNILYGWTGKEISFASKMNSLWDEFDAAQRRANKKEKIKK